MPFIDYGIYVIAAFILVTIVVTLVAAIRFFFRFARRVLPTPKLRQKL